MIYHKNLLCVTIAFIIGITDNINARINTLDKNRLTSPDDQQIAPEKKALIIGITGQDGAYLTELLLQKKYTVHGIKRRASLNNTHRIDHIFNDPMLNPDDRLILHYGDITDAVSILRIIKEIQPDEIYNLAAQSHVQVSFEMPTYTAQVDGIGTLNVLEAIRILGLTNKTKFYQASTSELFGLVQETPQKETTPFYPRSPYAASKLYAYWITKNYREAYKIFTCNGILFNHESPIRGDTFVTKKIARAVARIKYGLQDILYLGNLDAKRDWGHARDYVEAMWLMLQQPNPDDFVIATGETHSVREFVELAFKEARITLEWKGQGVDAYGIDIETKKTIVKVDPQFFRPTEVELLLGDSTKANTILGWKPRITFQKLVKEMVMSEMNIARGMAAIFSH